MTTRRTILKSGLSLPLLPLLGACGDDKNSQLTGFYEDGIYISGNFGPVDIESTITDIAVTGTIPEDLNGRFLRNGPNPYAEVDIESHHWFLGDGMVHGVKLEGGQANWYRNRWVRSARLANYLDSIDKNKLTVLGPNTNVINHGGRTWAIMESGTQPVELSYELETIGTDAGWGAYTAHPKYDPDTGEIHAMCYDWANYRTHIKYIVMDKNAKQVSSTDIPLPSMSMVHDMALTRNYAIIFDLPVTLSFVALALGSELPFRWDDDQEARVGLLPRGGSPDEIIWSTVPHSYVFHAMNAYEDTDGNVIIDTFRYDRMFDEDTNGPFGDSMPSFARWTVNPKTKQTSEQQVDDRPQEFPRCHPELNSKPYQYGYTVAVGEKSFPALYKHDMKSGESWSFDFGPGRHGAEPVFVPKESSSSEDDGYLMTFVYDEAKNTSDLVIIDAVDLSRPALALIHLPVRVPYGFHGNWVADPVMV